MLWRLPFRREWHRDVHVTTCNDAVVGVDLRVVFIQVEQHVVPERVVRTPRGIERFSIVGADLEVVYRHPLLQWENVFQSF